MKKLFKLISILLVLIMLLGAFAACKSKGNPAQGGESETVGIGGNLTDTEGEGGNETESEGSQTQESESGKETVSEPTGESESKPCEATESDTEESNLLAGEHAELIENADSLKNKVTAYYGDGNRTNVVFENMEMTLDYGISSAGPQKVTTLKNKVGKSYVENTMDVFVRMNDGNTYFASSSDMNGIFNIYRFGYYFYEMRVEEQDFLGDAEPKSTKKIDIRGANESNALTKAVFEDGVLKVQNDGTGVDSWLVISRNLKIDAARFNILEITMKADAKADSDAAVFYIAGSKSGFNSEQTCKFNIITDGEYHTYRIPLYNAVEYTGTFSGLRFDIDGAEAEYEISEIRALEMDVQSVPAYLSMARIFNVYSDKMHQTVQIAATKETANIAEVGILTEIPESKVAKLIVKDAAEKLHTSLDGVDWNTVEYIGFDIADAGVFGYILPYDGKGGGISVSLSDGVYRIEQTMTPEGGVIKPSRGEYSESLEDYEALAYANGNDFFMGSRVYTDDNHDFDEFLYEAYCERNPLSERNFRVVESSSMSAEYVGYDSLRGIYRFDLAGPSGGFNTCYYIEQNKHYRINFIIRGDDLDRKLYLMTHTASGSLECAAFLDDNDVMLPMPLEVGKNFSEPYGTGERNLYNIQDIAYGEVIFPMVIDSETKYEYTVLNLYQNWGNYPLKQLSWIQFYAPYYHLSTGIIETNCILPWTFTKQFHYNTLPDFRAMSAPFWADQPQHSSAGQHYWLKYTDSDGNVIRSENVYNTIDSYGPTYADVRMDYVSFDGKMRVSYVHSEMPQTDENRTFYEMSYTVLEDITINDFTNNFQFYSVDPNDPKGTYKRIGYLDGNNESVVVDANETSEPKKYVLGTACPYFSFFDMENWTSESQQGYSNVALLICNSEFVIGGEKVNPNFAILNYEDKIVLTLDMGDVKLKAGDSFKINAILLPWGSQLLSDGIEDAENGNYEYDMMVDGEPYLDRNVRLVRKNTLLSPLTAKAEKNCEVIESVFVPKLKTTNGESAEFTLSGGYNNVAVRVYGFDKMTVPVIYEKIDGDWKIYDVSSKNSEKWPHSYDGYSIHYDGDGSFSYSFVTTMNGESSRTFKIVADGNYEKWNKETVTTEERDDLLEIYVDYAELAESKTGAMLINQYIGSFETFDEEGFVRLFGYGPDSKEKEGYVYAYDPGIASTSAGSLLALRYRIPETNTDPISGFEVFISTEYRRPQNNDSMIKLPAIADGKWHTVIVDISKITSEKFNACVIAKDGKYTPQFIRWDFFGQRMSAESYVDFAFIGMDSSLENILSLSESDSFVTLLEGDKEYRVDPANGEMINITPTFPENPVNSSEYTESDLSFGAHIDFINGNVANLKSGSAIGGAAVNLFADSIADDTIADGATVKGTHVVVSGWFMVEGGTNRYVWSADGGVTWYDAEFYVMDAPASMVSPGNDAHLGVASNRTDGYTFVMSDGKNGIFSGTNSTEPRGIAADLEAYVGSTVDIIFGAVPEKDTSTIVPFLYVGRVTVHSQTEDAMTKEEKAEQDEEEDSQPIYNDYVKEGSGYSVTKLTYYSSVDMINARGGSDDVLSFTNRGGNTKEGIDIFEHNGGTVDGNYLVVSGWTVVNGGVEKYLWSADGGLTWNDVVLHVRSGYASVGEAHINVANNQLGMPGEIDLTSVSNSLYGSGTGLEIDNAAGIAAELSEYAGQTVDLIFAAVPNADNDTLCLIASITGVSVPAAKE